VDWIVTGYIATNLCMRRTPSSTSGPLIILQEFRRLLSSISRPFAILGRYSHQSFRVLGVISAPHAPLPSSLVEYFLLELVPSSPIFSSEIGGEELLEANDVIGRSNAFLRDGRSNPVDLGHRA